MASDRWCFNTRDGCNSSGCGDVVVLRKSCYILLLMILCTFFDSSVATAKFNDYYQYEISASNAKTLREYGSQPVLLSNDFKEAESVARRRRSPMEMNSSLNATDLRHGDTNQSSQQQQPVINASSKATASVSYSTYTETSIIPTSSTQRPSTTPDVEKPKNPPVKVSQPINPATDQPVGTILVWPNRTIWSNVPNKTVSEKKLEPHSTTDTKQLPGEESGAPKEKEKDKNDSDISDISIGKFSTDVTNKTLSQNNITKLENDTHQYYNSTFIINEAIGRKYWVDMDSHPDSTINDVLSESHRRAATVKLKFDFPFYGHKVRNITIATGGFLYTGEYVHSWLAATQYIAPLMANFDTSLSQNSYVKHADNGTAFTVVWEKVVLQDKPEAGTFTFQVTLHKNGDIVFVYSEIPVVVEDIEDTAHPVKVGLSDAYIMDRTVFFVRRKTIYEYHRVNFNRQDIKNWTVIYLRALPTCLDMDNCKDCVSKLTDFDCKWCVELNQCSTGTFRSRQDWLQKGCENKNIKEVYNCRSSTKTFKEHIDEYLSHGPVHTDQEISTRTDGALPKAAGSSSIEHGVIGVFLVVVLIIGLVFWGGYAYRNPHSTSGQMLIRYRPSQWSWRRGEARYTAATIHM